MTVSRAEYYAALKRVQEAMLNPYGTVEDLTLAALDLKRPPTEAREFGRIRQGFEDDYIEPEDRDEPPAEPPNTCPTCGGTKRIQELIPGVPARVCVADLPCPDCNGTGIDGGTA